MSADIEHIAEEDYAELEIAHEGQSADDAVSLKDVMPDSLRLKTFSKQIEAAKVSKSALIPFLGAVNIDLKRRNPIGLKDLFITWLNNGNKHWLNPMDKDNGLGALEEILFKYQGDVQALQPFVTLLTEFANEGISPRSFAEYVILPRMKEDNNWRKWLENHFEAVKIIANLINTIKDLPPFNHEHLGSGKTKLARDIVLVRYIGRPLALFQLPLLRDTALLNSYIQAWQRISLQDPLSLYFMRNNAMHFIYSMSGKIDLVQLIAIIEQLPDIERAFLAAFPEGITKLERIKAMNLYDYDINEALHSRKQHGYHSLDFATEVKAYFSIVKILLEKSTGVHLCAYYAGLLKRFKNPAIAEAISRLVHVVNDRGGMHIYKWHTEKLLTKPTDTMQNYISFIEGNRGCDPEYPQIYLLFRDEAIKHENRRILRFLADLGLESLFEGKNKDNISYKELIDAYIQKHPDTEELIHDYQQQLIAGTDRQWTKEYTRRLDKLSNRRMYGPLLRFVIRGIGTGWAHTQKCSGFTELLNKFGIVNSQKEITVRTRFDMPIRQVSDSSSDRDTLARKQINLESIEKTWNALVSSEPVNVNSTMQYINKWTMEVDTALKKAFTEKVSLEESPKDTDEQVRKKLEKNIAKKEKTIQVLEEKKQNYTNIMQNFDSLNNEKKFVVTLILAGAEGKSDEQFLEYVTRLLLNRYKELESVTTRLNFLVDDISVDVLTYQQLTYLLNLLETLFFVLREDAKLIDMLEPDLVETETPETNLPEADDLLQEILGPYLITKQKEITLDALDAAAKKMTGYAAMQAERAKWQGILVKLEEKDEKYFHDMEIYTSKSFIDSYYGDMGGICLSKFPHKIGREGFYVQRLVDHNDKQIIGMSILYLSTRGFNSLEAQAKNFWQAFGFNPLASILSHFTEEQQLYLYLQYRLNMEKISWATKLPVVLSGMETSWGLISNNGYFGNLIREYELKKETSKRVFNAKGVSVYYTQEQFANALVIIDPRGYEQVADPSLVPTFYATRELPSFFK